LHSLFNYTHAMQIGLILVINRFDNRALNRDKSPISEDISKVSLIFFTIE
jgi:hypothetical protein